MTERTPENFSQFEKLLAELARAEVDFAVVGGQRAPAARLFIRMGRGLGARVEN